MKLIKMRCGDSNTVSSVAEQAARDAFSDSTFGQGWVSCRSTIGGWVTDDPVDCFLTVDRRDAETFDFVIKATNPKNGIDVEIIDKRVRARNKAELKRIIEKELRSIGKIK